MALDVDHWEKAPVYNFLTKRVWNSYAWPEASLPMRGVKALDLTKYAVQSAYVPDHERTDSRPTLAWDYGRIRFFYEMIRSGQPVDPIYLFSSTTSIKRYAQTVEVDDGRHRLAAAHLANTPTIAARFYGRVHVASYFLGWRTLLSSRL